MFKTQYDNQDNKGYHLLNASEGPVQPSRRYTKSFMLKAAGFSIMALLGIAYYVSANNSVEKTHNGLDEDSLVQTNQCDARFKSFKNINDWNNYYGSGKVYTDSKFDNMMNGRTTKLIRPQDMISNKTPELFSSKGIFPYDVVQGSLANCYAHSTMAALAEHPERIQKIFTNTEYSKEGIYQLTLYPRGQPVKIVVDDKVPSKKNSNSPLYARLAPNKAIWPLIFEKAYAKLNNNYAGVSWGHAQLSFREYTGMPVETLQNDKDTIFNIIRIVKAKDWIAVISCCKDHKSIHKLVNNHSYTILDAITLKKDGRIIDKVLKMRNPYGPGHERYSGKWNRNDSSWTSELKKQVEHEGHDHFSNDSVFYMPVSYNKFFHDSFTVCMYQDWKIHQLTNESDKKSTYFYKKITSDVDQQLVVMWEYQNPKQAPKNCPKDEHQTSMYIERQNQPGQFYKPFEILKDLNYGMKKIRIRANRTHVLLFWDQNKKSLPIWKDFTVSVYADKEQVKLEDYVQPE